MAEVTRGDCGDDGSPRKPRPGPAAIGLLLLSAALLLLSIGQVRVISFQLWHHVTYLVVTVTLLGGAAGATFAALRRGVDPGARAALHAIAFALWTPACFALFARQPSHALAEPGDRFVALSSALSYLYLLLPFFHGGVAVAALLERDGAGVSRRYAVNLAGSAIGCALVFPALALGAPRLIALAALCGAAGALALAIAARRFRILAAVAVAAAAASVPFADRLFPFPVAAGKALSTELAAGRTILATAWDPIARVDVVGNEARDATLKLFQDGDAPSWMPSARGEFGKTLPAMYHALGYAIDLGTRLEVLVIGVGGGGDVKTALVMGARHVVGAEINAATAELMRGRFAEYTGGLYGDPRVDIEVVDGRSLIARTDRTFDLIQLTGADTYSALATGANLVAESYLYTQEAIDAYVDHLAPDGVLCVLRWRFHPPRETLRLVGMAARALAKAGAPDPRDNIAVIDVSASGTLYGTQRVDAHYGVALIKKSAFDPRELSILRRFVRDRPAPSPYSLAYLPGKANEKEFQDYLDAIHRGEEAARAYEDAYPLAIDPVTDDRPFFFQCFRGGDALARSDGGSTYFHVVIGQGPAGLLMLWLAFAGAVALVVLLVVVPLAAFARRGLAAVRGANAAIASAFFVAVGLGYMATEIPTLQRLTLYLGHPLRSLGLGLVTFLAGSGLGAAASARVRAGAEGKALRIAALAAAALLAVHALLLPALFRATLHLPDGARMAIAAGVLLPLAFALGMPFPLGLRRLRSGGAALLPWAVGVNGGASVIASAGAILMAMETGFRAVLLAAGGCYLLAAACAPRTSEP